MTNDARRAVIWLACLIAAVFLGDRIFALALERIMLRSHFRFSRVYAGRESAQIVVIGDSRGVNSIYAPGVTSSTGMPALNLSYNGMSMQIAEAVLADYVERNRAPRMVIAEVTCLAQSPLDLMTDMKSYATVSTRLERLAVDAHPWFAKASSLVHLLMFNSEIFLRSLYYLRRSDQDWVNRYTITPQLAGEAAVAPQWRIQVFDSNTAALLSSIKALRARGIEVRLIVGPYLPAYARRSTNLAAFVSGLRAQVRQVDPTIVVWDYSTAVQDPAYFQDFVHLNERGTAVLLEKMLKDQFFTIGKY